MAYRLIDISEANKHLKRLLVGDQITGYETGDFWVSKLLEGSRRRIAFQSMSSAQEQTINQALRLADETLFNCCDPEEIGWSVVLASVTRRVIQAATVDQKAALTFTFENDVEVTLKSDANAVDWQWCITKNSSVPYVGEAELACFWKSEVSCGNEA